MPDHSMTLRLAIPATLTLLVAPLTGVADAQRAPGPPPPPPPPGFSQFFFHEHIVIRIPRMPIIHPKKADRASPIAWREKRGPKCIGANDLGGAMIADPSTVDLVLAGNQRIRAKLDGDCQPIDFYGGVYIKPGADGRVCAARDAIRVRSGASCRIESFRRLVPGH